MHSRKNLKAGWKCKMSSVVDVNNFLLRIKLETLPSEFIENSAHFLKDITIYFRIIFSEHS